MEEVYDSILSHVGHYRRMMMMTKTVTTNDDYGENGDKSKLSKEEIL